MSQLWKSTRVLVIGLVAVLVVLGLALIGVAIGRVSDLATRDEPMDALANSTDECVTCHRNETPGIVEQYAYSSMAAGEVTCQDCHEVTGDYPGAVSHEGTYVLNSPTPRRCEPCHKAEVAQFYQSRHALPAYVAYAGSQDLSPEHLSLYKSVVEGSFAPDKARNALYAMEGPEITRFACEGCHTVGIPHADGSAGQCQKCHLRHSFSLEQARKPETCNACHIGPDHPQWEIYQESPHGIAYMTMGHTWNWEAEPGTLTAADLPAATCATCHMSGFGAASTTHDVGDRLTWYLFPAISKRRPDWEANLERMQSVCAACHNENFVVDFYEAADKATLAVNDWVVESDEVVQPLKDSGLMTAQPFDQPIDFLYFDLWHHWGRTTKFGAWMQGPDYSQWHGAYELLKDLTELRAMTEEMLAEEAE
jgi:hypothetical protein